MEIAAGTVIHTSIVPKLREVSAVAALSAHDAWTDNPFARGLDGESPRLLRPLIVFGRVPLFYYLLHLPLMHGIAVGFYYIRYGRAVDGLFMGPAGIPNFAHGYPAEYAYTLPVVYAIWLAVVVLLYPVCSWFARLKQRRRHAWLSYL